MVVLGSSEAGVFGFAGKADIFEIKKREAYKQSIIYAASFPFIL